MRAPNPLPSTLSIPNALSVDVEDLGATAVVHDWTGDLECEIAELTGARLEVESLTLEDIFLELHR